MLSKKDGDNVRWIDANGDGKFRGKNDKVGLRTEITLSDGTKVKVADNAYDIIMSLGGRAGGANVHRNPTTGEWVVTDCHTGEVKGKFKSEDAADDYVQQQLNK